MHYKILDPVDPDPQFYFAEKNNVFAAILISVNKLNYD